MEPEMERAIAEKRNFADELRTELENHRNNDVGNYHVFWDGFAYDRFMQRYETERHPKYLIKLIQCLEMQADDMERVLLAKRSNDEQLAAGLA
jgi:hypothetical protein